jgi:hypothetical protein
MSDFFGSISSFKKKEVAPRRNATIDEYVDILRDIYKNVGPDPQQFIMRMDNKLEQIQRDENIQLDYRFLPRTGDYKKRSKTLTFNKIRYSMATESVVPDRVYHNVYPATLRDAMEEKEVMYLTYLVDRAGLHMGRYDNIFEIGTGHGLLFTNEFKGFQTILAAGEIEIDADLNRIRFNFQSGTYMKDANIDRLPLYKKFLVEFVGAVLSRVNPDQETFLEVVFQDDILFPNIFPTLQTLRKDLIDRPDKVIDVEQKVGMDRVILFSTVGEAKSYFSRHPYERVDIRQGGVVYHNPYPDEPTLFIARDFETVQGASEYFSSHPYQSVVVKQGGELYCNPYKKYPNRFIQCEFPIRSLSPVRPAVRALSPARPAVRALSPTRPAMRALSPARPAMRALSPVRPAVRAMSPVRSSMRALSPARPAMRALSPARSSMRALSPARSSTRAFSPARPAMRALSPARSSMRALSPARSSMRALSPARPAVRALSPVRPAKRYSLRSSTRRK